MRVPVVLALALPLVVIGGGIGMYSLSRPAHSQTRTFYIAADEMAYAPAAHGSQQSAPGSYRTAVYQEYTDSTFATVKPRPAEWKHLSFLGPLIRAGVGDTIQVVFKNRVSFAANVHPDAVLNHANPRQNSLSVRTTAAAAGLGAESDDTPVQPGDTRVYTWAVPPSAGPGPEDHGSVLWLYHSHTGAAAGTEAGLIGPMIIYKHGALRHEMP